MLTNEEKINLRERSLRLAFELPIESNNGTHQSWGEDIYDFLIKGIDDDPLRLDIPSPCNGDCGMSYCDENGCTDKKDVIGSPAPMEIDWRRRQILALSTEILVEVSGDGDEAGRFNGYRLDSDLKRVSPVCNWYKSHFVYHGEIPKEQQEEPKTTGLNFLEAVAACKYGKNIRRPTWDGGDFLYCSGAMLYDESGEEVTSMTVCVHDILATDWQIVNS